MRKAKGATEHIGCSFCFVTIKEEGMKRVWTEERDHLLRRHYPKRDLGWLAKRLGVSEKALKSRAKKLGVRRKVRNYKLWTDREVAYLCKHYADMLSENIARKVHHTVRGVWVKASQLGLKKSSEFLSQCGREGANTEKATAHRFRKGNVPHNKGKRIEEFMSEDGINRSIRTRFKAGHRPHNTRDIGTECLHADGYVYIKADDGKMVLKHRYIWEQVNGKIPDDCVIAFLDGNPLNCNIENLEMVSRCEMCRRVTANETPEERAARVSKAQEKRNKAIRRDKIRIHWGLEPKGRLVKRW